MLGLEDMYIATYTPHEFYRTDVSAHDRNGHISTLVSFLVQCCHETATLAEVLLHNWIFQSIAIRFLQNI